MNGLPALPGAWSSPSTLTIAPRSIRLIVMPSSAARAPRLPPEREAEVARLLSQCVPHPKIVAYLSQTWGCTDRAVRRAIREVYYRWSKLPSTDPLARREQMRQAMFDFYGKALKAGAYSAAVTALDRLCKLDGLFAPDVTQERASTAAAAGVTDTDPDRVRARIQDLARKYGYTAEGAATAEPTGAGGEGFAKVIN